MIKLNYNGHDLQLDTVAELKELLKSNHVAQTAFSPALPEKRGVGRPRKNKTGAPRLSRNPWTTNEIMFILNNIDLGLSFFINAPELARHKTRYGADLMYKRIIANIRPKAGKRKQPLSRKVQKVVDVFMSSRNTNESPTSNGNNRWPFLSEVTSKETEKTSYLGN